MIINNLSSLLLTDTLYYYKTYTIHKILSYYKIDKNINEIK